MRLKVVLTRVLYQICANVGLLGVLVQNKRLYTFQACMFGKNSHTCSAQQNEATEAAILCAFKHTRIKQISGFTLLRQTRLNIVAIHFLGIYSIKHSDRKPFGHTLSTEAFSSVRSHFSLKNSSRNSGDAPLARVNA